MPENGGRGASSITLPGEEVPTLFTMVHVVLENYDANSVVPGTNCTPTALLFRASTAEPTAAQGASWSYVSTVGHSKAHTTAPIVSESALASLSDGRMLVVNRQSLQAYWYTTTTDANHTQWTPFKKMNSASMPAPHSVYPQMLRLLDGVLLLGGRAGVS